jgi:hypothetical protein
MVRGGTRHARSVMHAYICSMELRESDGVSTAKISGVLGSIFSVHSESVFRVEEEVACELLGYGAQQWRLAK